MKEMTLLDVQKVSLEILKDVHLFCESHSIKYSLAYGTLIGAIRHKGFIPWDDDVDILIPRPDFNRFCHEYQSLHGYKIYVPQDAKNFLTFARVCDNKHTQVITNRPWATESTGVWIDIFPLDGLPSNEGDFLELVKKIRLVATKIYRLRYGKFLNLSDTVGVKDFVQCLIRKVLYSSRYDMDTLLHEHIQLLESNRFEDADYYGQLCVIDYPEKEHTPKDCFSNYIKMPFCDTDFYVMNGYDKILRHYYGNYMELPSENDRNPYPLFKQSYFWK